jgi:hypothetical protein
MASFKYAYPNPPFNFLGRFTLTQWNAFQAWVAAREQNFPGITQFYQIRAQQLRKTAGLLEQYYTTQNDQTLTPTFEKDLWSPGPNGHFNYAINNDDHIPMVMMSRIKTRMKDMFQRDEDAIFYMNQLRCLIEKNEDMAQYNHNFAQTPPTTANNDNPYTLQPLLTKINSLFSKPEYVSVLVDDVNAANMYKGQPYFRVHQAETPTQWELEQMNHSSADTPIAIKEQST